uniref:SFRICE_017666 n=1 Tax=Spodoptera frugiperda TaxID=7108 RepID=A0A2H1VE98_SPOFR
MLNFKLPHWSSGRECDCRTKGLGFDCQVGQRVARSLELCPVWQYAHPLLHGTYNKNRKKWMYVIICTSAYPVDVKRRRADQDVTGGDDGDECDTSDIKVINARGMIQVGALPHQRGEETSPPCRCRRLGSDPLGWAARSRSRSAPLGSSLSPRADSAAERAARTVLS